MAFRTYMKQHNWWGKLLGAGLGTLIAGPPGALLGLFIGNLFDRGLHEHFSKPHWAYHTEQRPSVKQTFQRATFSIMGHVCKADGRVSEEEILFVKKIMRELHLNQSERASAQQFFTQGKAVTFNIHEPLNLLKNLAVDNSKLLHEFIQLQYRVAQVDGLTPQKINILNHILNALDLAPLHRQAHIHEGFHAHFNQYNTKEKTHTWNNQHTSTAYANTSLEDAYTLLGVSQHATKQDVKRAYRKQVSQYHPDKYIAKGRSEADIKKANEKTQSIRKAYESICKQKGWQY